VRAEQRHTRRGWKEMVAMRPVEISKTPPPQCSSASSLMSDGGRGAVRPVETSPNCGVGSIEVQNVTACVTRPRTHIYLHIDYSTCTIRVCLVAQGHGGNHDCRDDRAKNKSRMNTHERVSWSVSWYTGQRRARRICWFLLGLVLVYNINGRSHLQDDVFLLLIFIRA
jgi:hypothetical protein